MASKRNIKTTKTTKLKSTSKRLPGGKLDIDSKVFMLDVDRFADAFNYFIYGGEKVIDPADLESMDTTAIALPYGDNARAPIQKFRDILKKWVVKRPKNAVYAVCAIFGIENQSEISYVMPPRNMLYDAIGYDEQIRNARKSYKNKRGLTRAERMSGFKKTDKLIPIVTLVIYFGADDWDAPRSLKEMFSTQDERILQFVQNYEINLIEPYKLSEEDLKTFTTDLGLALKFIKYSKDEEKLDKAVHEDKRYRSLERDAFDLMKDITNADIEPIMRGDKVDMCAALDAMRMKERQAGRAEGITVGIDQANERVARDMLLEKGQPFTIPMIAKISKLSEDVIRGIAKSLGLDGLDFAVK